MNSKIILLSTPRRFYSYLRSVDLSYTVYNKDNNNAVKDSKPSLVLLHGLFGSKRNFDSIAKAFNQKTGIQIFSVDSRNHGESVHHPEMNYEAMSDDLEQFLIKHNLNNPIVLGHSMGGKAAMTLALKKPETIGALIIEDIAPSKGLTSDNELFPLIVKTLKEITFNSTHLSLPQARKAVAQQILPVVKDQRICEFLLTNLIQNNLKFEWRINLHAIDHNLKTIMDFPEFRNFSPYNGKTLFIGGSKSQHLREENKPQVKKYFPNAEIQMVEGSGHWVHADNPTEFLKILDDFVKTL